MIICNIKSTKIKNLDKYLKNIKTAAIMNIATLFDARSRLNPELRRLDALQIELSKQLNKKIDLRKVILNIIKHLTLSPDYNLELIDELDIMSYKLITFGNLSVKGCKIINKALQQGIEIGAVITWYGN